MSLSAQDFADRAVAFGLWGAWIRYTAFSWGLGVFKSLTWGFVDPDRGLA